jgi:hypothetical protein
MFDLVGQAQRPFHQRCGADEPDRPVAQGGERGVTVSASEFAQPDFLPDDVAEFDQQEVGSEQSIATAREASRFVRQRLGHEPLDGHTGIEDDVHRSRSSRRSRTLSVCGVPW